MALPFAKLITQLRFHIEHHDADFNARLSRIENKARGRI